MITEAEKQTLEWLQALKGEAASRGAVAKLASHGVLVLCLAKYATQEEQLELAEKRPPILPEDG